jgi:hypothetical protein
MAETLRKRNPEQFWRWARNVNILGGIGLVAAGVAFPGAQSVLFAGAALNSVQAVGAEAIRQRR